MTRLLLCVACLLPANVLLADVVTGNLLLNPSAEAGDDGSWGYYDSIRSEPSGLPAGTIQATEGTHWFGRGPAVAEEDRGSRLASPFVGAQQWVDIRDYVGIKSITVGMDAFAVSEVAAADFYHEVKIRPVVSLNLYDANYDWISSWWGGSTFGLGSGVDAENKVVLLEGLRATFLLDADDAPPEASYILAIFNVDSVIYNPALTNPLLSATLIAGIDNTFLSITANSVVPEPATLTMGLIALNLVAGGIVTRRLRRRAMRSRSR